MEVFVWLSHAVVPLIGWWLMVGQMEKLSARLLGWWDWKESFAQDSWKLVLLAICQGSPERHLQTLPETKWSLRLCLLWLGLRSLSYALIFLILFVFRSWMPVSLILLLTLSVFLLSQWWKGLKPFSLFLSGLCIFFFGFEALLSVTSQITRNAEISPWIYTLATNYFGGALIGAGMGAVIRGITRMSGVAWWSGFSLMLAGILSLGGAWGFVLGDFLMGVLLDFRGSPTKESKIRAVLAGGMGLLALFLSTPILSLAMTWMNDQYTAQIRSLQLGATCFVFLALETAVALLFFHFYFQRQARN